MSNRDTAAALACQGFRTFPLRPYDGKDANRAKRPAFKGWQAAASDDPMHVEATWPSDAHAPGVCTDGLAVLDFDVKSGGLVSLDKLRDRLPRTFTVRTPSGGFHYFFRTNAGRRLASRAFRADKTTGRKIYAFGDFDGVDVRAEGGLAVGPGATVDGSRFYTVVDDAPIADLPDELAELADNALPAVVRERGVMIGEADEPANVARAIEELRHSSPAVEGAGGDPHTIAVANSVMDFGVSPETCAELMLEHWNPRCSPPWDADDLAYKVSSAARSRREPIGCLNCDDAFAGIDGLPPKPKYPKAPAALSTSDLLTFPDEISTAGIIARAEGALIRGLLSPMDTAVLYGDSGAGKTFLALDLAWTLAQGKPWHGLKVKRAAVLYVGLEGKHGIEKRIEAKTVEHGTVERHLALLKPPITLVRAEQGWGGVECIVEASRRLANESGARTGLIVVDTLARAVAGDNENDAADMSHFVEQRAAKIAELTGAAVLIVHHENKSGGMRGSSALKGAADCVLQARTNKNEAGGIQGRSIFVEKVKDGEDGCELFAYRLRPVRLGATADGEAVTSCVVERELPSHSQADASDAQCQIELLSFIARGASGSTNYSPSPTANNYGPREFTKHTGYSAKQAEKASAALIASGRLEVQNYANGGKTSRRLAVMNMGALGIEPADEIFPDPAELAALMGPRLTASPSIPDRPALSCLDAPDASLDASLADASDAFRIPRPTSVQARNGGPFSGLDASRADAYPNKRPEPERRAVGRSGRFPSPFGRDR